MVIRIFLILLLFVSGVTAGDNISAKADSLLVSVRMALRATGAVTDQMTAGRSINRLNMAVQSVCNDFNAIVKYDTVLISSDSTGAALNTDFNRLASVMRIGRVVAYNDTVSVFYPLHVIEENNIDTLVRVMPTPDYQHKQGDIVSPSYCYASGQRLFTYPRMTTDPVVGDSFFVTYYANDIKIESGADSVTVLAKYREEVILYTTALLLEDLGLYTASDRKMALYISKIMKRSDVKGMTE